MSNGVCHIEIMTIQLYFNYYLIINDMMHTMVQNRVKSIPKATLYIIALIATIILPGCEVIGGIFKAGVWVGVIIVILIIGIISFIVAKFRK